MSSQTTASLLATEIDRLFPLFLEDPVDLAQSGGNAAYCLLGPEGNLLGRVFGRDQTRGHWCLGIAQRKLLQVSRTGYPTGRFEELVYAGKLEEGRFGLNRPDFIGWEGGVPLFLEDGRLLAAAFSGFRGFNDVAIITRAAAAIPGLSLRSF